MPILLGALGLALVCERRAIPRTRRFAADFAIFRDAGHVASGGVTWARQVGLEADAGGDTRLTGWRGQETPEIEAMRAKSAYNQRAGAP
jgi:hypothetical protein